MSDEKRADTSSKVTCGPCSGAKHNECLHSNCACAMNNHQSL